MARMDQVNELLKAELSALISRDSLLDSGLITISYVDCAPDLKTAKIGVSILPENITGTALKKLRSSSSSFSKRLRKKIRLKIIPKFRWEVDTTEREVEEIDDVFFKINNEEEIE